MYDPELTGDQLNLVDVAATKIDQPSSSSNSYATCIVLLDQEVLQDGT